MVSVLVGHTTFNFCSGINYVFKASLPSWVVVKIKRPKPDINMTPITLYEVPENSTNYRIQQHLRIRGLQSNG